MENKPASLLIVSLGKALNEMPPSLWGRPVAYSRTSKSYNCEVAHSACRKRRLLGTHHWQSALLVVGRPVIMTGSKWAAIFCIVVFVLYCQSLSTICEKENCIAYFGRDVRTRLGVVILEASRPSLFHFRCLTQGHNKRT